MSIAKLASVTGVSQPTVLRFVVLLASSVIRTQLLTGQSIVSGTPYVHSAVEPDDQLDEIVGKIFDLASTSSIWFGNRSIKWLFVVPSALFGCPPHRLLRHRRGEHSGDRSAA